MLTKVQVLLVNGNNENNKYCCVSLRQRIGCWS